MRAGVVERSRGPGTTRIAEVIEELDVGRGDCEIFTSKTQAPTGEPKLPIFALNVCFEVLHFPKAWGSGWDLKAKSEQL